MTLKQKIRLSNILMVFIPILVTAVVVIVCVNTSLGNYWHTLETMYKDENGIQSAQSLIYTYKKELWERDWQTTALDKSETMNHLEEKLADMGYYIQVKINGDKIYTSISDEDMAAAESVAGNGIHTAKMLTASKGNVSVIKYTFYRDDDTGSIIAVNNGHTDDNVKSYLQSYILTYIAGFAALFFVMILLVNAVLSWWISGNVLEPLKKLSRGTKEIREGNLETVIEYDRQDEFGEVCRDFDEMREYLKRSVEERLEYENRRRDLITGISHDLRTPLTSISGYVDGLLDGIAATPKMQERYLNAIKIRAKDLERLVDSLSDYNRLENGSIHYHLEPVNVKNFVDQYMEETRGEADKNHVRVSFVCEAKSCTALIDGKEFKRILDNLFTNAVRYRKKERSQVTIRLERSEDGRMIMFTFSDDGPGVPEESLERIFESFYRVDDSRTRAGEGSGIGLAVVREIVKGHGGTVHAENRNGLTVVIKIPAVQQMAHDRR